MRWANFFHIYQPPNWSLRIIRKVVKESYRPLIHIIKKYPQLQITLNVSGSLTEQLLEHGYDTLIKDIATLSRRNKIELVSSAMYHPILPLIPATEIKRQIKLNDSVNKKAFGASYRPRGFFPPEMAISLPVLKLLAAQGFHWVLMDEIADRGKNLTQSFNTKYHLAHTTLSPVFRNKTMSDYISFRADLRRPDLFWEELSTDHRSRKNLITAMDGESLGHHRPGAEKMWEKLVTSKHVTTTTISQLLQSYRSSQTIVPQKSSWSSRPDELRKKIPFVLWNDPTNPIHQLQWKLLKQTITTVQQNRRHPRFTEARMLLDRRLASDQFWWASAKPWWSRAIVKKKTKELVAISTMLGKNAGQAEQLGKKIITYVDRWQATNKFKNVSDRYLASSPDDNIRYMGGKRITQ